MTETRYGFDTIKIPLHLKIDEEKLTLEPTREPFNFFTGERLRSHYYRVSLETLKKMADDITDVTKEILPEQKRAVTDILQQYQVEHAWIGHTTATPSLQIKDAFTVPLAQAKTLFEHGLREKLL